jgi:hypothetical protein
MHHHGGESTKKYLTSAVAAALPPPHSCAMDSLSLSCYLENSLLFAAYSSKKPHRDKGSESTLAPLLD